MAVPPVDQPQRQATLCGAAFAERAAFEAAIAKSVPGGDAEMRGLVARLVRRAQSEADVPGELVPQHVAWSSSRS